VKDKDAMKKTMIEMSHRIGDSQLPPEAKAKKLTEFFELNKMELSALGPDTFMDIKNAISDILRKISQE
jgi:hypothetical protein